MLKFLFPFLFLVFTSFYAQNQAKKIPTDPTQRQQLAKKILENVSKKQLQYKTFQGEFAYVLVDKIKKKELQRKGSFWFNKSGKYKLKLDDPDLIFFYNGNQRVAYRVQEKEFEYLEEEDQPFSPKEIFQNYESKYRYVLSKEAECSRTNKNLCYVFTLYSKDKNEAEIGQLANGEIWIELFVDQKNEQVQKIINYEKNDRQTILEIFQTQSDVPIAEDQFDFNPKNYPGAEQI